MFVHVRDFFPLISLTMCIVSIMESLYRMPVGFGPALGPRQGPDGKRFSGERSHNTTFAVDFATEPELLAKALPPGFAPADPAVVSVRLSANESLPWLAGRAYHYFEVLFSVVFEGEQDRIEGDLVAVMWESMADPIIVGREECGHPKLFADIPDPASSDGVTHAHASWCDFTFLEMKLSGLTLEPWPAEDDAATTPVPPGNPRPRMNYKYFPSSADLSTADVAQVILLPPTTYTSDGLASWSGDGRVAFTRARWEDLPTFANIVNGLDDLTPVEWRGATMSRAYRRFNDLRDGMRILR